MRSAESPRSATGSILSKRIGERVVCDPYIRDPGDARPGSTAPAFVGADLRWRLSRSSFALPAENAIRDWRYASVSLDDAADRDLALFGRHGDEHAARWRKVGEGDRMLVTGASGGVGTFLVQLGTLARRRGRRGLRRRPSKRDALLSLGADGHDRSRGWKRMPRWPWRWPPVAEDRFSVDRRCRRG